MTTQLIATYTNFFDTWQGRANAVSSEVLATFDDYDLAVKTIPAIHDHLCETVDTFDYATITITYNGNTFYQTMTRQTAGYALEAEAHGASFHR